MSPLRVTCPVCGEQDIDPRDITLILYAQPHRDEYVFRCANCQDEISRPASKDVQDMLRPFRVRVLRLHTADGHPAGGPLTEDDLIELGLELERLPNGDDGGRYGCNGYAEDR